jgi:hypothetical protein
VADLVDAVWGCNKAEAIKASRSTHVDDVSVLLKYTDRDLLVHAAASLARRMGDHVEEINVKLDRGDKASALTSDQGLLRSAKLGFGELAGSAVDSVWKLGVDYGASGKRRTGQAVRRAKNTPAASSDPGGFANSVRSR